jgi:hypothetical protein
MKNQKRKSRRLTAELIPFLGFGLGKEGYSYANKKRTDFMFLFLFFNIKYEIIKHKMVRAVDVETSDL